MKLKEIKTDTEHYFVDEHNRKQGEYKEWHDNGKLSKHMIYTDGLRHGECIWWNKKSKLVFRQFYVNGDMGGGKYKISIAPLVEDMNNITDDERLLIKLKWGIPCLPK